MTLSGQTYYFEHIELILIFGAVGFILNKIALQKQFYKLPNSLHFNTKVSLIHVFLCFGIYLINSIFLAPFLFNKIHPFFSSYQLVAAWTQVFVMALSLLFLFGLFKWILFSDFKKLIKDPNGTSIAQDLVWGITTWILAFPLVAVVEQLADLIVYALFGVETYEQVAVAYLKTALSSPSQLTAALLLVLVTAPFMEEFLFRGFLQTWIKKHLGVKASILIASLCFSLFHISASHGVGNLSLVPSLFIFSCFLGFIYEKQKSLFASIILHSTFNLVSALRIIFTIDV